MNLGQPQWANPEPPRLSVSQQEDEFFAPLSTLDEPVMETIMRDATAVGAKLRVVLLPMDRSVSVFCRRRKECNILYYSLVGGSSVQYGTWL
jgi:hypothetical protein